MAGKFFSKLTCGFYTKSIHGTAIPDDAKEIDQARYDELMAGASDGKIISSDDDGYPILILPPEQPAAEKALAELESRVSIANQQIAILKPAVDGGYAKPEHTQLLADWQRYRYELTLVPEQTGWPESPQWPTEPDKVI
ncbi:tail fiber assembly protein [Aeromonas sp. 30P]|uniref:tail fiber assembly protein n=1 Tax=Aeromonas sp. 30P TaxID=3452717 RepID=UPI003F78C6A4